MTKILFIRTGDDDLTQASPGASIALQTGLDPALTKSDSLSGNVVGHPSKLPTVYYDLTLVPHLLQRVVGSDKELDVEPVKKGESFMLNVNSAATVGIVNDLAKNQFTVKLKLPVCCSPEDRITISRLVGHRFRLIGYGSLKQ